MLKQLHREEVSATSGSPCRSNFTSEDDKGLACQILFAPGDALPSFVAETVKYKGDFPVMSWTFFTLLMSAGCLSLPSPPEECQKAFLSWGSNDEAAASC